MTFKQLGILHQLAKWKVVRRKEVWTLTKRAKTGLIVLILGVGTLVFRSAHSFLAITAPVESTILVVEGWTPEYALTNFMAKKPHFTLIVTTGGPTIHDRTSKDPSDTYASVSLERLVKFGIPANQVRMVPIFDAPRDRTYTSAVALRQWCETNGIAISSFNVVTLGTHARRSRLLHEKAFPATVKVGIFSLENEDYDASHWWRYSEGVKEVLSEGFAYLYARFFFQPN